MLSRYCEIRPASLQVEMVFKVDRRNMRNTKQRAQLESQWLRGRTIELLSPNVSRLINWNATSWRVLVESKLHVEHKRKTNFRCTVTTLERGALDSDFRIRVRFLLESIQKVHFNYVKSHCTIAETQSPSNPLHVFWSRSSDFCHVVTPICVDGVPSLTFLLIFIYVRIGMLSVSFVSARISSFKILSSRRKYLLASERHWSWRRFVFFVALKFTAELR